MARVLGARQARKEFPCQPVASKILENTLHVSHGRRYLELDVG